MQPILVIGAGKIGSLISVLLASSKNYKVYLADVTVDTLALKNLIAKVAKQNIIIELTQLDANNPAKITDFVRKHKIQTVVSSLPYYCNIAIATIAKELELNYFDLTEDTNTTGAVTKLAENAKTAFVPQCGLAPGFISIVANDVMQGFNEIDTVKMRVGALPVNVSNPLQYLLTWSTEGLINEYGNPCQAIDNGVEVTRFPLDDLEEIKLDGLTYEAFNTSGGVGSLAKTYFGRLKQLNYKTIRYPGHCERMFFLMNELKLNYDRDTLKRILENILPKTGQDVVLVYVSVTGKQDGQLFEKNYFKKFYPQTIHDMTWSAIQLTTACGICGVLDLVLTAPQKYKGLVKQEQFSLNEFTQNRFGKYYGE